MVGQRSSKLGRGRPRLPCSGHGWPWLAAEARRARPAAGLHGLAVPYSHGRHVRRLHGQARLLPRPVETDLTWVDRAPSVSGSPLNFGRNGRATLPCGGRTHHASASISLRYASREGQPVPALSVNSRGLSHGPAGGKWMVRPNRRRFWRAQPSRTPPARYGARRERTMARLNRHRCERFRNRR